MDGKNEHAGPKSDAPHTCHSQQHGQFVNKQHGDLGNTTTTVGIPIWRETANACAGRYLKGHCRTQREIVVDILFPSARFDLLVLQQFFGRAENLLGAEHHSAIVNE